MSGKGRLSSDVRDVPGQAVFFMNAIEIYGPKVSPPRHSALAMKIYGLLCTTRERLLLKESIALCLEAADPWEDVADCTQALLGAFTVKESEFLAAIREVLDSTAVALERDNGLAGVLLGIIRHFSAAPRHLWEGHHAMEAMRKKAQRQDALKEAGLYKILLFFVRPSRRAVLRTPRVDEYSKQLDKAVKEFVRGNTVTYRPAYHTGFESTQHFKHPNTRKRTVKRLLLRAQEFLKSSGVLNELGTLFVEKIAYARFGELSTTGMVNVLAELHPTKTDGSRVIS